MICRIFGTLILCRCTKLRNKLQRRPLRLPRVVVAVVLRAMLPRKLQGAGRIKLIPWC